MAKNIVTREQDYSQWYLDVIKAAKLADYSPVRGCMVIRPEGYALWEAMQADLDRRFKQTGHVNAYFPLLIPVSFLQKEAEHVEGFAMECAVVTHSGLENRDGEGLVVKGQLEEPLIVRPTSETVIGHMYSKWIQSYRDLPVLINQWANVMRWEMRTRLFLRTSEFLWQEGHTAHETQEEAVTETERMLGVYADFAREVLALPVIEGKKSESEKFPGAVTTYCIETLMQDNKALQAGTSHYLGQNFAKAFDIQFLGRDNQQHHVYTTSWGVSTRLIGAVIMTHSDDEGLILPPKLAPIVSAIIPIWRKEHEKQEVVDYAWQMAEALCGKERCEQARSYQKDQEIVKVFLDDQARQQVVIDLRDSRPVEKHYHWEQRGVPFRLEAGPRDIKKGQLVVKKRFDMSREFLPLETITSEWLSQEIEQTQQAMLDKARQRQDDNTVEVSTLKELEEALKERKGFVKCFFNQDEKAEMEIKERTKGTVRAILLDPKEGTCVYSGEPSTSQVLFAQSY